MNKYAIIVAGGIGTRMKSESPKQFLMLDNKPIIVHTIEHFLKIDSITIYLTLPKEHFDTWRNIKATYLPHIEINIIEGGESRFHSVKNALTAIHDGNGLVAIHDGVRPLISTSIIEQSYLVASSSGSAVASVPLKDSLREISGSDNTAKDRNNYQLVQTPQTFKLSAIKKAFSQEYRSSFTDDASVYEADGNNIHLIMGSYKNIKITTKEDLLFASSLLKPTKPK